MKTLGVSLRIVVVTFVVSGCGGSAFTAGGGDAGGSDAASAPSDDQACGDRAHANCLKTATCSTEVLSTTYGDEGRCETRLKLNCLNALAAASNGNSAQADEACAQAYASLSCADYFDLMPASACLQATGSVVSGQPCGAPGQCETGFCAIMPGLACGKCAPVPKAGDSCAELTTCGQLLTCVASTKLCAAFAAEGAPCSTGQLCGAGLFCVGAASAAGGTCQPAVEQVGAACDPQGKTGPGCDRIVGLTCSSITKVCAPIVFAAAGEPCGANVGSQFAACADGATCTGASADASATATCVSTAPDLGACDLAAGPFCLEPARCVVSGDSATSGTCQFPNALACH